MTIGGSPEPLLIRNKRSSSLRPVVYESRHMYLVAGVVRMIRGWHKYNEYLRELNRLDDRESADIGITRCDIQRIAFESARG